MEGVIIIAELDHRLSRSPDYESESRALTALMQQLANSGDGTVSTTSTSSGILQKVVESAVELCRAHSAGISLVEEENGDTLIRWRATAGRWAHHSGRAMPRHGSPCGTVVDRNAALLLAHPRRLYPLLPTDPPATEMLLIPFHCSGESVGTVWIVAHEEARKFDAEDHRLMASLGRFATAAYQLQLDREAKIRLAEQLEAELAAAQRLQETSLQLIREGDADALYGHILDAAVSLMRSDFASIHMLHPERGANGELRLLGHRGFNERTAAAWQWVRPNSEAPCGAALGIGHRVIVPDVQACDFMAGSCDLEISLQNGIRAAQSTPLLSRSGQVIGMISTHWRQPHRPSERDLRLLDVLARQAADLIERSRVEAALRASEQRFRTMADTTPAILCVTEQDGACSFISRGWYDFTGQSEAEGLGFGWMNAVHPDDRATTHDSYLEANERQEAFAREHRVRRVDGEYRWMMCAGRPRFRSSGEFCGYMVSIIDITERKLAEERTKILMREVNHRSKNLLAVVQAVARQTAGLDEPTTFARRFSERIAGLAASQDLLVRNDWQGVDIDELVCSQLAHFVGLIGSRIMLEGPPLRLSPTAAQTIGMALNELATNAGKYGALSDGNGSVTVSWEVVAGDRSSPVRMRWVEHGGPPVTKPQRQGFGHTVMVRMVEHALDATVNLEHAPSGLVWQITVPARSLMDEVKVSP